MSEKNTGGPAYPTISNVENKQDWITEEGMALRDYFAGQVLVGVTSLPDAEWCPDDYPVGTAKFCYQIADAMLKERTP